MDNTKDNTASRLKRLRLSNNLTQEQMAEALGISEALYKGNELGRFPLSKKTALLIEERFGVSADYMLLGILRETNDIWTKILECEEIEKMKIMLRLFKYFSLQGTFNFSDDVILDIIRSLNIEQ